MVMAQILPPDAPAVAEAAPALSSLDAALAAPVAEADPNVMAAPEPAGPKDALLQPLPGAGLTEPTDLPQNTAMQDPNATQPQLVPTVTAPPVDAAPVAPTPPVPQVILPQSLLPAVTGLAPVRSTVLKPAELKPSVSGVLTNHFPQIGAAPKHDDYDTAALPQIGAAAVADTTARTNQPITKFARKFDGPVSKPRFVILLQDVGAAGMRREDLAKLPFPVSFVVDPLAADAKEAASTYRAAGQEVLMLANGLPVGANASAVAQTFQTLADILPEAVGVIDEATLGFQDNRAFATIVLPVIADQGRGLVTYDKGLNAADQIARRDGLPAAVIFRRLDGAGESRPTIRRNLDRAAFKAAQQGSVVVIGDTRKETVVAILEWTLEGKAANMALAPVTAVMLGR